MGGVEGFLEQYGLAAIFLIMLVKSIGVPIPIPGDVLMLFTAARAAQGYFPIWLAFGVILVALVAGSLVQYGLARGPGRGILYRHGKVIGLSPERLDKASATVGRGGPLAIAVSILTPLRGPMTEPHPQGLETPPPGPDARQKTRSGAGGPAPELHAPRLRRANPASRRESSTSVAIESE